MLNQKFGKTADETPIILVVEDDIHIAELIRFNLEAADFRVITASDGKSGFCRIMETKPDLVILDRMLPDLDGIEICREVRKNKSLRQTLIIMATAMGNECDRIAGLEQGADDYISKPFSVRELVARVKALLRRKSDGDETMDAMSQLLKCGLLEMDQLRHEVKIKQKPVELTLKEYALLQQLLRNWGKVMTREILMERIWGYDYIGETRTVDVHIRNLRKKFAEAGIEDYIETVRNVGYKINKNQ